MRMEILSHERRRRWLVEEKLAIVSSVGVDGATVTEVSRIASREMLPDCWLLPHLICSRHLWVRSKSDEVDQRDDEK